MSFVPEGTSSKTERTVVRGDVGLSKLGSPTLSESKEREGLLGDKKSVVPVTRSY